MTDRDERIRKAAYSCADIIIWRLLGLPIIICAILAVGCLVCVIASLFEN